MASSRIDDLHAALADDIARITAAKRHRPVTASDYVRQNANVQQVRMLQRVPRIARDVQAPDEPAGVDLGKLNDIKAVFTSGSLCRGMPKEEFIDRVAPLLCPSYPDEVDTWYDTVDADASGFVSWMKLSAVLLGQAEQGDLAAQKMSTELEQNHLYQTVPRLARRPIKSVVQLCKFDGHRRRLLVGTEDGAVSEVDLNDPDLPLARTIHHGDGSTLLDMDVCPSRGQLLTASTTGHMFTYDLTDTYTSRTAWLVRAFQPSPASEKERATAIASVPKTLPYDPHRMVGARPRGFAQQVRGRLATVDVPFTILNRDARKMRIGEHVLSSCCLAPELYVPSAGLHSDHVSPIVMGTVSGHVCWYPAVASLANTTHTNTPAVDPRLCWHPHTDNVTAVRMSSEVSFYGVLSASLDGTANLFDVRHEGTTWTVRTPHCHKTHGRHPVTGIDLCPSRSLVATWGRSRTVNLWTFHAQHRVAALTDHPEPVVAAAFCDQYMQLVTLAEDDILRVWDVRTQRVLQTLRCSGAIMGTAESVFEGRKTSCLTIDTSTHAIVTVGSGAAVYDDVLHATKKQLNNDFPKEYQGHYDAVFHVALADNGSDVITADKRRVSVWHQDGSRVNTFAPSGAHDIHVITAMPNNTVLVATTAQVEMWKYHPPQRIRTYAGLSRGLTAAPMPPLAVVHATQTQRGTHGMTPHIVALANSRLTMWPTAGTSADETVLHAPDTVPTWQVDVLIHSHEHFHDGTLRSVVYVPHEQSLMVLTSAGDWMCVTMNDAFKGPHVMGCVQWQHVPTRCRLAKFDEAASKAAAAAQKHRSSLLTQSSMRPSTAQLWQRARRVVAAEARLGSASFTRFKHQAQQTILRAADFCLLLPLSLVIAFRGDGDALIWSMKYPTSRRRAEASWYQLLVCFPATFDLGACATGASFCEATGVLSVSDTCGHMSFFRLDCDALARDGYVDDDQRPASHFRAVSNRVYVIPPAVKLLSAKFMCRDIVNCVRTVANGTETYDPNPAEPAADDFSPEASLSRVFSGISRSRSRFAIEQRRYTIVAIGTEAANAALLKIVVDGVKAGSVSPAAVCGDTRGMLEPVDATDEHRFFWLTDTQRKRSPSPPLPDAASEAGSPLLSPTQSPNFGPSANNNPPPPQREEVFGIASDMSAAATDNEERLGRILASRPYIRGASATPQHLRNRLTAGLNVSAVTDGNTSGEQSPAQSSPSAPAAAAAPTASKEYRVSATAVELLRRAFAAESRSEQPKSNSAISYRTLKLSGVDDIWSRQRGGTK